MSTMMCTRGFIVIVTLMVSCGTVCDGDRLVGHPDAEQSLNTRLHIDVGNLAENLPRSLRSKRNINLLANFLSSNASSVPQSQAATSDPNKLEGLLSSCQLTNVLLYQMVQQLQQRQAAAAQLNPLLSLATPSLQGISTLNLPKALSLGTGINPLTQAIPIGQNQQFLIGKGGGLHTYITTKTFVTQTSTAAVYTIPLLFGNKPHPTTITRTKTYNVTMSEVQTLTSTITPTFITPTKVADQVSKVVPTVSPHQLQYPTSNELDDEDYYDDFENDVQESQVEEYHDDQPQVSEVHDNLEYDENDAKQEEENGRNKALAIIEARRQKGFTRPKPKPSYSNPSDFSKSSDSKYTRTRGSYRPKEKDYKYRASGHSKHYGDSKRDRLFRSRSTTTPTPYSWARNRKQETKPTSRGTYKHHSENDRKNKFIRRKTVYRTTPSTTTTTTPAPENEYDSNYYDYYYPQQYGTSGTQQEKRDQAGHRGYSTSNNKHQYRKYGSDGYYESNRRHDDTNYRRHDNNDYKYYNGRRLKRDEFEQEDFQESRAKPVIIQRRQLQLEPSTDAGDFDSPAGSNRCPTFEQVTITSTVTATKTLTKLVNPSPSKRARLSTQTGRATGINYDYNGRSDRSTGSQSEWVNDQVNAQSSSSPSHSNRRADILKGRSRFNRYLSSNPHLQ